MRRLTHALCHQKCNVKKARVEQSSTSEDHFSATPDRMNEIVLLYIDLDDTVGLVTDTGTIVPEMWYESITAILCLLYKFLYHLDQCSSDPEMKIDVILTDPPYNFRQELGREASYDDLSSEDNTILRRGICVVTILNLVSVRIYSVYQITFWRLLNIIPPQLICHL